MNIKNTISKRRTLKLLNNNSLPLENEISIEDIEDLILHAGKAPFHYPVNKETLSNNKLKSIVPWRFYILDAKTCRDLAEHYKEHNIEGGKITQMLHTATTLIQTTWIPEPFKENDQIPFHQKNIEHVAATSAAIQNLLLVATEKNLETYWSSGGTLRDPSFKKLLNIPLNEQLLGSIFLFNKSDIKNSKQVTGAWRNKQGDIKDFSSFVTI